MELMEYIADNYILTRLNSNIIKCRFTKDFFYSTELAWQIFDNCNQLAEQPQYKMLWIMKTRLQPQKELFDFYADPKRAENILSEAFCLNSTPIKMMANFYFRAKKPKIPSKVFDDENLSIKWLTEN